MTTNDKPRRYCLDLDHCCLPDVRELEEEIQRLHEERDKALERVREWQERTLALKQDKTVLLEQREEMQARLDQLRGSSHDD